MNTQHFNDQSHFHVKQHKNNKWRWRKRCWWWCWNKEESDHWLNIENHHHHHEGDKWRRMWYGCKKQQENKSIVAVVQVVGGITITRRLHIVCNTFRFCSNYRAVRKFDSVLSCNYLFNNLNLKNTSYILRHRKFARIVYQ